MEPQDMSQANPNFGNSEHYLNYIKQQFFIYFYSECQRKGMTESTALQEANKLATEYVQAHYVQPFINAQHNQNQQLLYQQQQQQQQQQLQQQQQQQLQQHHLQQQLHQQHLQMLQTSPSTTSSQSSNQKLREQHMQLQHQLQQQQLQQQQLQQQYLYQQQQQALIHQYNTANYDILNSSRTPQAPTSSIQTSWDPKNAENSASISTFTGNSHISTQVSNSLPSATPKPSAITLPVNRNKRPSVQIILNNSRKIMPQVSKPSNLPPSPNIPQTSPVTSQSQNLLNTEGSQHAHLTSTPNAISTSLPSQSNIKADDKMTPITIQPPSTISNSRFDLTLQQAALKKAQEGARAIEESHRQLSNSSSIPISSEINGKDSDMFNPHKLDSSNKRKEYHSTPVSLKEAPKVDPNTPNKAKHKSTDIAFSEWLQKVYASHGQDTSIEWRKTILAYNESIIKKFKNGSFYNIHWASEPIPTADEIRRLIKEDHIISPPPPSKEPKNAYIHKSTPPKIQTKDKLGDVPSDSSLDTDSDNGAEDLNQYPQFNEPSEFIPILKNAKKSRRQSKPSQKKQKHAILTPKESGFEQSKREQRLKRFGDSADDIESSISEFKILPSPTTATQKIMPPLGSLNWQERLELAKTPLKVIGMSTQLEKQFLRLTGLPNPENVRPIEILKKSFIFVQEQYTKNKNWAYIEEQFRSIRQDLSVQAIKNQFTVEVYETNARLALTNHDLGQFNQCQTQLRELHKTIEPDDPMNRIEFLCYRVIYMALQNMKTHLLRVLAEIEEGMHNVKEVNFALNLRRAIVEGNWRRYFTLAKNGPFNTKDLCDIFEEKIRLNALLSMSKLATSDHLSH